MKINKFVIGLAIALWILPLRAEVETAELPDLVVGGVGLETGLTAAVWGEPWNQKDVETELQKIQNISFGPAEREILKRILLTRTGEKDVLIPRLEALMAQGFFEEVLTLTDRIPPAQQSPEVRQFRIRALMANGKTAEACQDENIALSDDEIFIRTVCALMLRTPDEGALAFDVYRESGRDNHPFLNAVGDKTVRYEEVSLPDGRPDWIEWPLVAAAFGDKIPQLPLREGERQLLARSTIVPDSVKEQIRTKQQDKLPEKENALSLLNQYNAVRERLERLVPKVPEASDGGI